MTTIFLPDTQRADAFRRDAAQRRLARTGRGRRRIRGHDSVSRSSDDSDRYASSP